LIAIAIVRDLQSGGRDAEVGEAKVRKKAEKLERNKSLEWKES